MLKECLRSFHPAREVIFKTQLRKLNYTLPVGEDNSIHVPNLYDSLKQVCVGIASVVDNSGNPLSSSLIPIPQGLNLRVQQGEKEGICLLLQTHFQKVVETIARDQKDLIAKVVQEYNQLISRRSIDLSGDLAVYPGFLNYQIPQSG